MYTWNNNVSSKYDVIHHAYEYHMKKNMEKIKRKVKIS